MTALGAVAWWQQDVIRTAIDSMIPSAAVVEVPGQDGTFFLDALEVTNGACINAEICAANDYPAEIPAVQVSAKQAVRYCANIGGRLPSESEWLSVAGADDWPWGSEPPSCAHAVALGCANGVMAVGSTPEGRSSDGVYDLAGNVWEWVLREDGSTVLVGGGATSPISELGKGAVHIRLPGEPLGLFGFRCAYDERPSR
jgi:hypothetical protein